jgi:hypothetical protein
MPIGQNAYTILPRPSAGGSIKKIDIDLICYCHFNIFVYMSNPKFQLLFLGTGTSGTTPSIACITAPNPEDACKCCLTAIDGTEQGKKNVRKNTGAILRVFGDKKKGGEDR